MSRYDDALLDEILYARVLLTLQKQQLENQDRRLRERLREVLAGETDVASRCGEALRRAWARVATDVGLDEDEGAADLSGVAA